LGLDPQSSQLADGLDVRQAGFVGLWLIVHRATYERMMLRCGHKWEAPWSDGDARS
jgi:hypothetical protein